MSKKKPYDPAKALEVPLTSYEQEIEDGLACGEWEAADADKATVEKFRNAARATLREMRGGRRPGAGRRPRLHVRTTVLLEPELRRKLEGMAVSDGSSLSATVERLIRSA